MRILYVAQNYLPRNASSITTFGIIKKLMEKGHEITLVVPKRCSKEDLKSSSMDFENDGKVIVRTPTIVPYYVIDTSKKMRALILSFSHLFLILKALSIYKKRKFDLIISQHHSSHFATLSAFLLSKVFKLPFLVKTHDVYDIAYGFFESLYLCFLDGIYRALLKHANCVFVVSKPLKLMVMQTHNLREDKVLVFPNFVDTEIFRPDRDSSYLRRDLGIEDKRVLLFIGGITEDRGLTLLISVLQRIIAENSDIVLLVVGKGPQKSNLENLAHNLDVERFVRFVKPVDHNEIPNYIKMADITIGPLVARIDTFGSVPLKVLEYMACAKPVLACRGGVSQDLLIEGHNGFLFHPGDTEALSTVILRMLNSCDLMKKVGLNAREYVKKFYDEDKTMSKLEEMLRLTSSRCRTVHKEKKYEGSSWLSLDCSTQSGTEKEQG